jgi:hypothetical protein
MGLRELAQFWVDCPRCGAPAGQPCRTNAHRWRVHAARIRAVNEDLRRLDAEAADERAAGPVSGG